MFPILAFLMLLFLAVPVAIGMAKRKRKVKGHNIPIVKILWAVGVMQRFGLFATADLFYRQATSGTIDWQAIGAQAASEGGDIGKWVVTAVEGTILKIATKVVGRVPLISFGKYKVSLF